MGWEPEHTKYRFVQADGPIDKNYKEVIDRINRHRRVIRNGLYELEIGLFHVLVINMPEVVFEKLPHFLYKFRPDWVDKHYPKWSKGIKGYYTCKISEKVKSKLIIKNPDLVCGFDTSWVSRTHNDIYKAYMARFKVTQELIDNLIRIKEFETDCSEIHD